MSPGGVSPKSQAVLCLKEVEEAKEVKKVFSQAKGF